MDHPKTTLTRMEREMVDQDTGTTTARTRTCHGIDPDGLLDYLRETTQACLDPASLAEGEFPDRFLSNALEALTTFAALDTWLSGGGRPPFAWTRMWHPLPTTPTPIPATCHQGDHEPRKDPTP